MVDHVSQKGCFKEILSFFEGLFNGKYREQMGGKKDEF